jgi:hypothetical protein
MLRISESTLVLVLLSLLWSCGGSDGGRLDEAPSNPPTISNPAPASSSVLPMGTTVTTLSVETDHDAECRFATSANNSFDAITDHFKTTGSTNHSTTINNLADGHTYNYFIRCKDNEDNVNNVDYVITFSVAT